MMNPYLKNLNKIEFVVTYACTGRCRHCSEGDHDACGARIDPQIAAEAVRKVAEKYNLPFVDMQAVYDAACERADASVWTGDGAHPTAGGHELIKRAWLAAFEKLKER